MLCVASFTLSAEKYMIVDMSSDSIKIGGRTLRTCDVFNDDASITWTTNPQWITIKSIRDGRISKLSRKQFESKSAVKSLKDFYLRSSKASTRGSAGYSLNFIESDSKAKFPERRIALIIGNSDYSFMDKLKNPVNDASDIADELLDLGFDVLLLYNGSWQEMRSALQEFTDKAAGYEAAVFYYSGHGTQYSTQSYLVPLGNSMQSEVALERCIACNEVISALEKTLCKTRIAFFDACRTVPSWDIDMSQEVSSVEARPGSVIFFSTRSGRVAQDGDGRNSPFANALISNIGKPLAFIKLEDLLVKETYNRTQQYQFPIYSGTLLSDFQFNRNYDVRATQPSHIPPGPNDNKLSISGGGGVFSVRASCRKRNDDNATIDLYITNEAKDKIKMSVCSNTEAFADNWSKFGWNDGMIQVFKNDKDIVGYPFICPPNVPVKITLKLNNILSSVNSIPLINLVLSYNDGRGWTDTTVKIENWDLESAADDMPSEPAGEPSLTLSTSDFAVCGQYLERSGDDMIMGLDITNKTNGMIEMYICKNTEAFADKGFTFGCNDGMIQVLKNGKDIEDDPFSCEPDKLVRIALKINRVSSSINYFRQINVVIRHKTATTDWVEATCCLINWPKND
jgi:hypothetical protein